MCWNEAPISDDSQFEGWWDHWSQVVRIGVNGFTIPFNAVVNRSQEEWCNALTRPEPVQNLHNSGTINFVSPYNSDTGTPYAADFEKLIVVERVI